MTHLSSVPCGRVLSSRRGMDGRISTEEVLMTEAQGGASGTKTLGIKLPDEVHAQLVLIASLDKLSLTDAIRQAIDYYIERKRGEGDLAARAAHAMEEIEREARLRREALTSLFGPQAPATADGEPGAAKRRGRDGS